MADGAGGRAGAGAHRAPGPAHGALEALREIEDLAKRMEESGKVDLSVLDPLRRLRERAGRLGAEWASSGNDGRFYYYMAARVAEFVAMRMIERFEAAQASGDNPKAAADALRAIPAMRGAIAAAAPEGACAPDKIIDLTWSMMDATAEADLSCDEVMSRTIRVDDKTRGEMCDRIMEEIGIPVEECREGSKDEDIR